MLIAGIDIETTGFEPAEHRMVEIYIGLWDLATERQLFTWGQRIDPQRSITPGAQKAHGISILDLVGSPTWDTVGPKVEVILKKADFFVAHNGASFDLPFINSELRRIGLNPVDRPLIDTIEARWASPVGKSPTLQEVCFACDVPYDPELAHAAEYDVQVMMAAFFRGLRWKHYSLPSPPESVRAAA